jgi:hypothetical protein
MPSEKRRQRRSKISVIADIANESAAVEEEGFENNDVNVLDVADAYEGKKTSDADPATSSRAFLLRAISDQGELQKQVDERQQVEEMLFESLRRTYGDDVAPAVALSLDGRRFYADSAVVRNGKPVALIEFKVFGSASPRAVLRNLRAVIDDYEDFLSGAQKAPTLVVVLAVPNLVRTVLVQQLLALVDEVRDEFPLVRIGLVGSKLLGTADEIDGALKPLIDPLLSEDGA